MDRIGDDNIKKVIQTPKLELRLIASLITAIFSYLIRIKAEVRLLEIRERDRWRDRSEGINER